MILNYALNCLIVKDPCIQKITAGIELLAFDTFAAMYVSETETYQNIYL